MKKLLKMKTKGQLINFVLNYEIIIRNIASDLGYVDGEALAQKYKYKGGQNGNEG